MPKVKRHTVPSSPRGYTLDLVEVTGDLTLAEQHIDCVLQVSGAAQITLPGNLRDGFHCTIEQSGSGTVSFAAGTGATLNNRQGHTDLAGQYAIGAVYVSDKAKPLEAAWVLTGDTA